MDEDRRLAEVEVAVKKRKEACEKAKRAYAPAGVDARKATQFEHSDLDVAKAGRKRRAPRQPGRNYKKRLCRRKNCGAGPFGSTREMTDHEIDAHGAPSHECLSCKLRFKTRAHLRRHNYGENAEGTPAECSCGETFSTRCAMRQHRRGNCSAVSHVCDECGAGYESKFALKNHMLKHSREYPVWCSCGTGFTCESAMERHRRESPLHNEHGSYACEICPKRFNVASSLAQHIKKHRAILAAAERDGF